VHFLCSLCITFILFLHVVEFHSCSCGFMINKKLYVFVWQVWLTSGFSGNLALEIYVLYCHLYVALFANEHKCYRLFLVEGGVLKSVTSFFAKFCIKYIHCVPKKEATKLWAVTLSNLNRF